MRADLRPFVRLALCVALPIAAASAFAPRESYAPPTAPLRADDPSFEPAVASPDADPVVEHSFLGQGGTLAEACERAGLDPETQRRVLETAARHLDLRRLSPRTGIAVRRDATGRPISLSIRSEAERFLRVTLPPDGEVPRAELLPLPVETRVEKSAGLVSSSVAQALAPVSHSHLLTQAYADVFQWDVDLLVDPRPGDQVKLIYEVEILGTVPPDLPRFGDSASAPGEFVGLGRILAASYQGSVVEATAFWVEDGNSRGDYYDADGRPLRKSFLKSPLNYRRISSGFSRARRHPVTRKVVPHHGIDFAANPGTPITATADGRVISAGWDGPLGIAVRLRHGSEFVTVYGHMNNFARGIKPGVDVQQGQVIGYVGSTGRATGPHLHYTVLQHGRPIDPMQMKNPSVDPLDESDLPWLAESRRRFLPLLQAMHASPRVDVAVTAPSGDADEPKILSGS